MVKKAAPTIVEGANGRWSRGDEDGLTFRSDADYADFIEVKRLAVIWGMVSREMTSTMPTCGGMRQWSGR